MRIGVVSDMHGQERALERALELMGPIDRLFALGDSIDQSSFSARVVGLLKERDALAILGNHEEMFFQAPGAAARLQAVNEKELLDWLAARPPRLEIELAGRRILLVHSTPWPSNHAYVPPGNAKFSRFAESGVDIVLYGHTHLPVVREVGATLVVNPGSVGQGRPTERGFVQSCAVLNLANRQAEVIDFVA